MTKAPSTERKTYPNILSYTEPYKLPSEIQSEKSNRRLNKAIIRKMMIDQAKLPNVAKFYCEHCQTYLPITYGIFCKDTHRPIFQQIPQYICRDGAHKKQTRYQRITK